MKKVSPRKPLKRRPATNVLLSEHTEVANKVCPRLSDPFSWTLLGIGASSRYLGQPYFTISVLWWPYKKCEGFLYGHQSRYKHVAIPFWHFSSVAQLLSTSPEWRSTFWKFNANSVGTFPYLHTKSSAGSIPQNLWIAIDWESIENQFFILQNWFFLTIPW